MIALRNLVRRLFDDGLNHDWDGEWTDADAEDVRNHLRDVEERSLMEDKLKAWSRWL